MTSPEQMQSPSSDIPAWRSPRAWFVLALVVCVGLAADLISKDWAFRTVAANPVILDYEDVVSGKGQIPFHDGVRALSPNLLDFRLVLNRGAVFGIGQGQRLAFVVFTLVAIGVALSVFGWWTRSKAILAHVAIGLILAGGLGNLYDRLMIGAVRDFLNMLPRRDLPFGISWPQGDTSVFPWVFNVADVELLVGMSLLLIYVHLSDRKARLALKESEEKPVTESNQASEGHPGEG